MRVYFVGAQSVGKSTLARLVAKELKLPFLSEIARTILAEKEYQIDSLRTNLEIADAFQSEIAVRQIEEESKYTEFVSDRSLDHLAYMAQHARMLSRTLADPKFKEYIESLKKDDVITFFIRPTKTTIKSDGVRETLVWEGVIAIDGMIKFMLEMLDIDYIPIHTDNMQERVKIVNNVIKLFKRKAN